MKLPKTLLSAIAVGVAVQATGCSKKDTPTPTTELTSKIVKSTPASPPANCPACGLG